MTIMPPYLIQHILDSYRWLGHQGHFTELNAIPSKTEHGDDSKTGRFAQVWYARHEGDLIGFVKKHYEHHMVCFGINPRPKLLRMPMGSGARSARETEIAVGQNLVFDFDVTGPDEKIGGQIEALDHFLNRSDEFYLDRRLRPPIKAFTGQGYHALFAYPAIAVEDCPDIAQRLRQFCEQFRHAYRTELANLGAKLDSTHDLRRMVKIYGTAKPEVQIVSRFHAKERIEDEQLRAYLLELEPREEPHSAIRVSRELPLWFEGVMQTDARTRELWAGTGKAHGSDTSRSGYDYSLTLRLLRLGHTNIDELATILSLRPEGSVQKSAKGDAYVRRTIANALLRPIAPLTDETSGIERKISV